MPLTCSHWCSWTPDNCWTTVRAVTKLSSDDCYNYICPFSAADLSLSTTGMSHVEHQQFVGCVLCCHWTVSLQQKSLAGGCGDTTERGGVSQNLWLTRQFIQFEKSEIWKVCLHCWYWPWYQLTQSVYEWHSPPAHCTGSIHLKVQ